MSVPLKEWKFKVEIAPSSRSSCKSCHCGIREDSARVGRLVVSRRFDGFTTYWYHLRCITPRVRSFNSVTFLSQLEGIDTIRYNDQAHIRETFMRKRKPKGRGRKRRKKEDVDRNSWIDDLKEQNDEYFANFDILSRLDRASLVSLLKHNNQSTKGGLYNLLSRCADGMTFGALLPCPSCSSNGIQCSHGVFECGKVGTWAKCTWNSLEPQRTEWKVPEDFEGLPSYYEPTQKTRKRILAAEYSREDEVMFENEQFVICEGVSGEIPEIITVGGGIICDYLERNVDMVVIPKGVKMEDIPTAVSAAKMQVSVMREDYFTACREKGKSWIVDDGEYRMNDVDEGMGDTAPNYSSPFVKMENGVDSEFPMSGYELVESEVGKCSAVLSKTDLTTDRNSFYVIQLLKKKDDIMLWARWGRIGTSKGDSDYGGIYGESRGIKVFDEKFFEKTGNHWKDKDNFEKKPGKYNMLHIE